MRNISLLCCSCPISTIQFLRYNKLLKTEQIAGLEANVKEQMGHISKLQEADCGKDCTIDAMQQYIRRDCIEITGIAILPLDNPKQLVLELGLLIGVSISGEQISTAHRLTKEVKTRIIAKFLQRDKIKDLNKKKKNQIGKKSS